MNELLYNALYSTGLEVYALKAPQNKKPPFAIYQMISDKKELCADGITPLKEVSYQLDVYSENYDVCKTMMETLQSAIIASTDFETVIYSVNDTIEDSGLIYRSRLDFNLWK